VQDHEVLRDRPVGHGQRDLPPLEHLRGHVLKPLGTEVAHDPIRSVAIVSQRGRLARPIVLDVAQPLRRRAGHRCPCLHHARKLRAPDLREDVIQPRLGEAFRQEPRRRATTTRPRRPDLLLHLPAVRQAVLGVPDRTARALDAEYVAARWKRCPSRPIRELNPTFGTYLHFVDPAPDRYKPVKPPFSSHDAAKESNLPSRG
jgi:hypothetical protein